MLMLIFFSDDVLVLSKHLCSKTM